MMHVTRVTMSQCAQPAALQLLRQSIPAAIEADAAERRSRVDGEPLERSQET
jgi:hypothetical protein